MSDSLLCRAALAMSGVLKSLSCIKNLTGTDAVSAAQNLAVDLVKERAVAVWGECEDMVRGSDIFVYVDWSRGGCL